MSVRLLCYRLKLHWKRAIICRDQHPQTTTLSCLLPCILQPRSKPHVHVLLTITSTARAQVASRNLPMSQMMTLKREHLHQRYFAHNPDTDRRWDNHIKKNTWASLNDGNRTSCARCRREFVLTIVAHEYLCQIKAIFNLACIHFRASNKVIHFCGVQCFPLWCIRMYIGPAPKWRLSSAVKTCRVRPLCIWQGPPGDSTALESLLHPPRHLLRFPPVKNAQHLQNRNKLRNYSSEISLTRYLAKSSSYVPHYIHYFTKAYKQFQK